jgi:hypothetical protein
LCTQKRLLSLLSSSLFSLASGKPWRGA